MYRYLVGLDLGQASDYSALAVAERTPYDDGSAAYAVRHLHRWPLKTPYPQIVADATALVTDVARLGPDATTALLTDGTGVGRAVVDLFDPADLAGDFYPVVITGGERVSRDGDEWRVPKRNLVAVVQVALQRGRLKIAAGLPEAATLVRELAAFEMKISEAGRDSYGAWRENRHDDLVLAVALALWGGEEPELLPAAWGVPVSGKVIGVPHERYRRARVTLTAEEVQRYLYVAPGLPERR